MGSYVGLSVKANNMNELSCKLGYLYIPMNVNKVAFKFVVHLWLYESKEYLFVLFAKQAKDV